MARSSGPPRRTARPVLRSGARALRTCGDDGPAGNLARRPDRRIRPGPVRACGTSCDPSRPISAAALYFAATSLLTLGFGDIVAVGAPARIIVADRRDQWARRRRACGHVPLLAVRLLSAPGGRGRRPPGCGRARRRRPSRSSRPMRNSIWSSGFRPCSSNGSAGRSRCSTPTSPTRCSRSSAPATTTCPGSAPWGRSSMPPASCSRRSMACRAARPSCSSGSARISSRISTTSAFAPASRRTWTARRSTPPAIDSRKPAISSCPAMRSGPGSRPPERPTLSAWRRWRATWRCRQRRGSATRSHSVAAPPAGRSVDAGSRAARWESDHTRGPGSYRMCIVRAVAFLPPAVSVPLTVSVSLPARPVALSVQVAFQVDGPTFLNATA